MQLERTKRISRNTGKYPGVFYGARSETLYRSLTPGVSVKEFLRRYVAYAKAFRDEAK